MKRQLTTLLLALMAIVAQAQMLNPVKVTAQLNELKDGEGEIVFTATIDKGWHVYSTDLGDDGPVSASFGTNRMSGVQTVGRLQALGKEIKQYDEMFGMVLRYFELSATFVQKVRFTEPEYDIDCYLEYGACDDHSCLPPTTCQLQKKGRANVSKQATEETAGKNNEAEHDTADKGNGQLTDNAPAAQLDSLTTELAKSSADVDLWQPSIDEMRAMEGSDDLESKSLLYILLMGFVGGLLAVCMPCIWPIIPMTVSFFLKRAKTDRKKGVSDAVTYGLSIVVIYLGLGLLVTALFGSDTLNALSTNAVFNIFLFLLLVAFALSFFGWFEIRLPESWANRTDQMSESVKVKSSSLSIFLMAFTLVLVSFSCTAPIVGLLLVETATSGNWLSPAVGMLGFAVALAMPFTLFALFPSWLKQVPKSGAWMTTLKVVLGFIELAFALKFLSVADLAYGWHILPREVFLSLWIVIFSLLGAYLCGWLKFQEDEIGGQINRPMPVVCIMGGLLSLAFAVYMLPGLWGAPCKAVSAFAPPMNTQDFNLNSRVVEARYTDYEQGMAVARSEGKPVLIDFTGFGCVNCRKMEAAVWTDPTVADILTKDFVLISLYVDDKTLLKEPFEVADTISHTKKALTSVGAKWSYLQSHKFGTNAQPFYVMIDPATGKPLAGSRAYNEDIAAYIQFLKEGLSRYKTLR